MKVALLTGGKDPHYALALVRELRTRGVDVAFVGSDDLVPARDGGPGALEFHNLIGSQGGHVVAKMWRVLRYYGRVVRFAVQTDARIFHVLWFRKFPVVERVLLNGFFKLLGKTLIFTAHNVDDRARDGKATALANRLSLGFLYRSVAHVFVHTERMKSEIVERFRIRTDKITVVPFGINDVIPRSSASRADAKRRRGFEADERVILFFGNIAPYKGVEDLVRAFAELAREDPRCTLVVAGHPKDPSCESYWQATEALIDELGLAPRVRRELGYIPDDEVGDIFRSADVSVLPYRRVYQSGVLALSYAQGVPAVVADVGSLKEDVIEGETGFVFRPGDVRDLAAKLRAFFSTDLFADLDTRSRKIAEYGAERFSWATNADLTCRVYARTVNG